MYKFTFCMHDCKNIDTFIPGKMGKFLEKSGKNQEILSVKKSGNSAYVCQQTLIYLPTAHGLGLVFQ